MIIAKNQQFLSCSVVHGLGALLALIGVSAFAQSNGPVVKVTSPVRLLTALESQEHDSASQPHDPVVKMTSPVHLPTTPGCQEHDSASGAHGPRAGTSTQPRPLPKTVVSAFLRKILPESSRPSLLDALGRANSSDASPASNRQQDGEGRQNLRDENTNANAVEFTGQAQRIANPSHKTYAPPVENATEDSDPANRRSRFVRRETDRLQRLASLEQRQRTSESDFHKAPNTDKRSELISFLRNATYGDEQWSAVASVTRITPIAETQAPDRDSDETARTNAEEPQESPQPVKPTVVNAEQPRPAEPAKPAIGDTEKRERSEPTESTDANADTANAAQDDSDTTKADERGEDDEPSQAIDLDEDGLKSIRELTLDIRPEEGELPRDLAAAKFLDAGEIRHLPGTNRPWPLYEFWWEAPAVCHRPLYFEEVNLERYGYSHGLTQSLLSGAHFFGRIPALPYLMTAEPHRDCVYTLGHYPPGSYAPYHLHYPPVSLRAAAVEAAVVTGLIFAIP